MSDELTGWKREEAGGIKKVIGSFCYFILKENNLGHVKRGWWDFLEGYVGSYKLQSDAKRAAHRDATTKL